jgi:hypothetical protein
MLTRMAEGRFRGSDVDALSGRSGQSLARGDEENRERGGEWRDWVWRRRREEEEEE